MVAVAQVDLIRSLLKFSPHERMTAQDALRHPFLAAYHEEPSVKPTPLKPEWLTITELSSMPREQLQNLIFQEMLLYHPEVLGVHWGAG